MSVGFYLLGEFKKAQLEPKKLLDQLDTWISKELADLWPTTRQGFVEEKPCLFASLHPAGEEVEIVLPDPNHITVSANTSTVGPGYHVLLCDSIRRWTDEFAIQWPEFSGDDETTFGDETEYFFRNDSKSVYDEMERWLRTLTGSFFDGTMDPDAKEIALCMPMNVLFEGDHLAITQLGPRDKDWLYRMSQGSTNPREFFPWYEMGLNAQYYLGRALTHMWSDVRWRKPATDNEERLLKSVLRLLQTSYRMDSSLKFPWSEWKEILNLLDEKVPDYVDGKASDRARIGYRRANVKTCLPGSWWIKTEGSFSAFESDKDGTLCSLDPPREIWFTAYSFSAENPEETFRRMRNEVLKQEHEFVQEGEKYISVADIKQNSEDGIHYVLHGRSTGVLCRSILTLVFRQPSDRDWAIQVWKSLESPKYRKPA